LTVIYTASFGAYRADMGQAVPIPLGLSRLLPEAQQWPRAWVLTPASQMFAEPDNLVFADAYVARLERFGAAKIARTLERIAREHQAEVLVLCCHEADPARCHRSLAADWLIRGTAEVVDELS